MKVLPLLLLLVAGLSISSLAVVLGQEDDLMTPEEAALREKLDGLGDAFDSEADDNDSEDDEDLVDDVDEDDESDGNSALSATVTDDGMIQIEDELLTPEQFELLYPPVRAIPGSLEIKTLHADKRAAVTQRSKLWPGGRIPYTYSKRLVGSTAKIRSAMNAWQKETCLKFELRKPTDKFYVVLRTLRQPDGTVKGVCSSTIGRRQKPGAQYVNLAPRCYSRHTLLHELGHTIGLLHEHQHPNRDKYVEIHWSNVLVKKTGNFRLSSAGSSWGIAYDPQSVMHYRAGTFSKCKGCKTITSKSNAKIGGASKLSPKSDILIVKKMYSCKQ